MLYRSFAYAPEYIYKVYYLLQIMSHLTAVLPSFCWIDAIAHSTLRRRPLVSCVYKDWIPLHAFVLNTLHLFHELGRFSVITPDR